MQQVGGGQRVVERAVGRAVVEAEAVGQRAQPAVGHLVAHEPAGQRHGVDERLREPVPACAAEGGVEEPEVEPDVVADDHGAADELGQRRAARLERGGRAATIASVMPVRTVMAGGMALPGVDERLERAQALAAPDLDRADLGDGSSVGEPPVVSRSSTQNVTSAAASRGRRTTAAWPAR